jgi:hypothetical protein
MDFLSPNVILVYAPPFAGGKFIMNCLAMSRHCIISDSRFAEQDLNFTNHDATFYKFKLDSVLQSLPPADKINQWRLYEFQEWVFAGIKNDDYAHRTIEDLRSHKFNPILSKVLDSQRYHCFLSHYYNTTVGFQQVWPNTKIITLVNWQKFIKLAGTLKSLSNENIDNHLSHLLDHPSTLSWPSLIYDVDHSIFSQENHLRSIKTLYHALGWDDFQEDLIEQYYSEYRYLHGY